MVRRFLAGDDWSERSAVAALTEPNQGQRRGRCSPPHWLDRGRRVGSEKRAKKPRCWLVGVAQSPSQPKQRGRGSLARWGIADNSFIPYPRLFSAFLRRRQRVGRPWRRPGSVRLGGLQPAQPPLQRRTAVWHSRIRQRNKCLTDNSKRDRVRRATVFECPPEATS